MGTKIPNSSYAIYHDSLREYILASKEKENPEGNSDKLVLSGLLH